MLSKEANIKTARLLCKAVTGRTSAAPLAALNKYLRPYNDTYAVELVKSVKKTPFSQAYLILETKGLSTHDPEVPPRRKNLNLPCSLETFVLTVTGLDALAEQDLGLTYGAQRES